MKSKKPKPKVKKIKKVELVDDIEVEGPIRDANADTETLPSLTDDLGGGADALAKYLADVRKYPLLSPDEEKKLAIRYRETGDRVAAEKLVTSNLRFVIKVAGEYAKFGAKMIDLIQEGNVGLMHAVREFNPYKGVRLITYAVWWIRGYIQEYLMKNYSQVKIGTTQAQKKLFYRLNKERARLEALGEGSGVLELSQSLGVKPEEIEEMTQRLSAKDLSLDAPFSSDDNKTWLENQTDVTAHTADEDIALSEEREIFDREIGKVSSLLNDKEKFLLEKRILGDPPLTLQEVGDHFGITRERARQLEERTIDKIKVHFSKVFPDYQIKVPEDS